MDKNVKVFM